jgi:hypothetical protein
MDSSRAKKGRAEDPVRPTEGETDLAEAGPHGKRPMETKAYVYRLSTLLSR